LPKGANKTLLDVIDLDADFLASCNIIDYSLLIGEIKLKDDGDEGIEELREVCNNLPDFGTSVYLDSDKKAYLIGIIDPLTGFTWKKSIEYHAKRLKHGLNASCIPPPLYANRFKDFLRNEVFEEGMFMKLKKLLIKKLHIIAEEQLTHNHAE
jgi:1-phosphatidylinositol-3-phosphate 5-kinase